jgi:hypothetical protein
MEKVLSYLQQGNHSGNMVTFTPFHLYVTCYRVLRASGDPRADDVLEEAHSLLRDRAASISDEGERRMYLENVAANREIVEAWAEREQTQGRETKDE